jgi:hypothetical protein
MGRRQVFTVTRDEVERDSSGAPRLLRVGTLLSTLERMLDHRETKLEEQSDSPGTLGYYAKERDALKAAIAALTYHRATIERFPEFVFALDDLLESVEGIQESQVAAARKRAQVVLDEYQALV